MASALRQQLGSVFACCKQVLQIRVAAAAQTARNLQSPLAAGQRVAQSSHGATAHQQLVLARAFHKSPNANSAAQPVGPSLTRLFEAPPYVIAIGLSGLLPFVGLIPPVAAHLPLPDIIGAQPAFWQVSYGATILSFLGGVHWGACLAGGHASSTSRFLWSVCPSLLAWPAVALSTVPACGTLAASLVLALGVDQSYARVGLLPSWYSALRWPLTAVAASSLLATAALSCKEPEAAPEKK
mmetsp:Transcript_8196/g.14180  ORF Transcript_8196/g.14180 Transcript_8196/m.14180 type:complete len:240 (-) Transcript_8196:52-771(-)|eukprot:CAMPEP_0198197614 /NCGR_PEP_ID=MMETSP1445-20131203/1174_1 /TAXON_ID=36898 /ORGANISM="Pyramimonas sp., Strain CCMP2087" /LENGTH=239 /DNA_ID=CAMNT_0043866939 /DNA_START=67 /DNA_END=786 /DNA_ORIENTATION=+